MVSLLKHVLRVHSDFLGFEDAKEPTIDEKVVVGRLVGGGQFFDCVAGKGGKVQAIVVADDLPRRIQRTQSGVDTLLPC